MPSSYRKSRSRLGGNTSLKANHRDKGYNVTLEHVFETAKGNLSSSRTNSTRARRKDWFPFLLNSKKSVSEGTFSTVEDSMETGHASNYDVAHSGRDDDSEAIFLMRDSGMGKTTHASTRGMLFKTLRRVARPKFKPSNTSAAYEF
mmetsp:Transcript_26075/g.38564  ORF Transcript_26075/g.38564 Transcript_26075/m.38564 type:complete len:146 (+) Transcript_26075:162-599(+)